MTDRTSKWTQDDVRHLRLEQLNERLRRYRLAQPKLEKNMLQSLERYGQISPIVVCLHEDEYVLIDGFKRLTAARTLKGMTGLKAQRMDVDEQGAKAAIYNLNCIVGRPAELEESWIVQALVREDGLSQVEAAQLLGRHKSWVNRRLAMIERLCEAAHEELRLGLLTGSVGPPIDTVAARQPGGHFTHRARSVTYFQRAFRRRRLATGQQYAGTDGVCLKQTALRVAASRRAIHP